MNCGRPSTVCPLLLSPLVTAPGQWPCGASCALVRDLTAAKVWQSFCETLHISFLYFHPCTSVADYKKSPQVPWTVDGQALCALCCSPLLLQPRVSDPVELLVLWSVNLVTAAKVWQSFRETLHILSYCILGSEVCFNFYFYPYLLGGFHIACSVSSYSLAPGGLSAMLSLVLRFISLFYCVAAYQLPIGSRHQLHSALCQ